MGESKNDILQGTLALLVLKTLASNKRLHGYAITTHIQSVSANAPNGASPGKTGRPASTR
jgi:hypothetical protein